MAFKLRKSDVQSTPPVEYLPATAGETYTVGEALVLTDGAVTKCGATTAPGFIAAGSGPVNGGLPVWRIQKYMTFEAPLSAAGTALKIGDKVTLHTDGLQVTATTTSGVAEIAAIDGTAIGDTVAVRF